MFLITIFILQIYAFMSNWQHLYGWIFYAIRRMPRFYRQSARDSYEI